MAKLLESGQQKDRSCYMFFLIMPGNYQTHPSPDKHKISPLTLSHESTSVTIVLKTHILDMMPPGWPTTTSSVSSHMRSTYMSLLSLSRKYQEKSFQHRAFAQTIPSISMFSLSPCSSHYHHFSCLVNVYSSFRYFLDPSQPP